MEKKIIMKTHTKKVLAPPVEERLPKAASGERRILALTIDCLIIYGFFQISKKMLDVKFIFPLELQPFSDYLLLFYFYLTLTIIPHAFFAQTIGKFFLGIKLVSADSYKGGGVFSIVIRDLFFRPLVLVTPWSLFSKYGKATQDKICKTIVVESR